MLSRIFPAFRWRSHIWKASYRYRGPVANCKSGTDSGWGTAEVLVRSRWRTGGTYADRGVPHDAIIGHELGHTYIGHEGLTQFLEVYVYNLVETGSTEFSGWIWTRGEYVPFAADNTGFRAPGWTSTNSWARKPWDVPTRGSTRSVRPTESPSAPLPAQSSRKRLQPTSEPRSLPWQIRSESPGGAVCRCGVFATRSRVRCADRAWRWGLGSARVHRWRRLDPDLRPLCERSEGIVRVHLLTSGCCCLGSNGVAMW